MPQNPSQPARRRPSGRRSGDSGTREAIVDAARDLFAQLGYEGASLRAIAARAGVDAALIRHFFGDKETLFTTTVVHRSNIPERMATTFAGPIESLGERATDAYLQLWQEEETRGILLGLVRSAMTTKHGIEPLLEMLGGRVRDLSSDASGADPNPEQLALAAAHLFGVAVARELFKVPALVRLSHQELVERVAPAIQSYLVTEPN